MKYNLEIIGRLENLSELYLDPEPATRWYMKIRCMNCGDMQGKPGESIYFDTEPKPTSTGQHAHYVAKCKDCKRHLTITLVQNSWHPYRSNDEVEPAYQTVAQFEARGVEPLEYEFRGGGWKAKTSYSDKIFTDLEFTPPDSNGVDWCDFDEDANKSIGAYDLKSRFKHIRP